MSLNPQERHFPQLLFLQLGLLSFETSLNLIFSVAWMKLILKGTILKILQKRWENTKMLHTDNWLCIKMLEHIHYRCSNDLKFGTRNYENFLNLKILMTVFDLRFALKFKNNPRQLLVYWFKAWNLNWNFLLHCHIQTCSGNILGEWSSGLRCCEQIGRFLVQAPLSTHPGTGTQPRYEVPNDLWLKNWQKMQLLKLDEEGGPLNNGSKMTALQPNSR